ncbi:unnamed protein product [Zymoseptoria tritici ST99CH_3D7]|uniref:Uncharacterized protein n=1 Tax=Zymoseptoria tritici (strain ST99CH_3D7) TaxID=1276538 RepID=A0A1X7S4P8_ZYMT9|nr:unnamed protein product [Zymoseptoria tritici ST99CH_3D7]
MLISCSQLCSQLTRKLYNRLRIFEIVVGSQNRRDTEKLLLTNHASSHEAKQIQHEIIPFKIHLRVDHREATNTVSTIMTVGRSGTELSFYSWINHTIAPHASLLDDKYHSALSVEQHFPAQLKQCRHIKLQFAIGCRLGFSTPVGAFKQASQFIFALLSFLRNDVSTKCRSLTIDLTWNASSNIRSPITREVTRETLMLSAATLKDALWPLQYLHPEITLSIVGELPPGFLSIDFDEKRAASVGKQDSIALYNTLRPRYDLAMGALEPSEELAIKLNNAMLTVRQVGPNGDFASTSTSDEAACTALHKLEEDMLDLPMKGLLAAKATLEVKKVVQEKEAKNGL